MHRRRHQVGATEVGRDDVIEPLRGFCLATSWGEEPVRVLRRKSNYFSVYRDATVLRMTSDLDKSHLTYSVANYFRVRVHARDDLSWVISHIEIRWNDPRLEKAETVARSVFENIICDFEKQGHYGQLSIFVPLYDGPRPLTAVAALCELIDTILPNGNLRDNGKEYCFMIKELVRSKTKSQPSEKKRMVWIAKCPVTELRFNSEREPDSIEHLAMTVLDSCLPQVRSKSMGAMTDLLRSQMPNEVPDACKENLSSPEAGIYCAYTTTDLILVGLVLCYVIGNGHRRCPSGVHFTTNRGRKRVRRTAYIEYTATHDNFKRCGIATVLVTNLLDNLRKLNVERVILQSSLWDWETDDVNMERLESSADCFWLNFGFRRIPWTEFSLAVQNRIKPQYENANPMCLLL